MQIANLLAENKAHMLRAELAMILFCLFAVLSQNVQQSSIALSKQQEGAGSSTLRYETLVISASGGAIFQNQAFANSEELASYLVSQNQLFIKVQADELPLSQLREQWLNPLVAEDISLAF